MFSSRLATAVHVLLYINEYEEDEKITSEVLADTTGVNAVNIRKILSSLKRAGMIEVKPGVGGAYMAKKAEDITLRNIFEAVEERDTNLFRMHEHPNVNCPVGRTIASVLNGKLDYIKADMLQKMDKIKLSDMYEDMKCKLENECDS